MLVTLLLCASGISWAQEEAPAEATVAGQEAPTQDLVVPVEPPPLGLTGRQIMEKVKEHVNNPDEISRVEMILVSKSGSQRSRMMEIKRKKDLKTDLDKVLLRFKSPDDIRGTSLLTWEEPIGNSDQQWIYLPALKKTKKIAGANKQDDFVGSDMTYEDMRSEKLDNFSYQVVQETPMHVVVDATPKIADSAYSRRRITVRKEGFLIDAAEYYDKKLALLKKLKASEHVEVEPGRWRTNLVEVKNVQNEHGTILKVHARKLNQGMSNADFTKRSLEQGV
jgi:hypothetical protein